MRLLYSFSQLGFLLITKSVILKGMEPSLTSESAGLHRHQAYALTLRPWFESRKQTSSVKWHGIWLTGHGVQSLGWEDPPGVRERLPTPVSRPGAFHGLYSPWSHKELDTTERLSLGRRCTKEGEMGRDAPYPGKWDSLKQQWASITDWAAGWWDVPSGAWRSGGRSSNSNKSVAAAAIIKKMVMADMYCSWGAVHSTKSFKGISFNPRRNPMRLIYFLASSYRW